MTPEIRLIASPNFAAEEIPVEFLVIHYTACTLEDTLRIFTTGEKQLCAHFVIDTDGMVYDLGGFWAGPIRRGAHAGVSSFELEGRKWEKFNAFSIGIELVNFNGNLLPYPPAQYESVASVARHLASRFPALASPSRVVGHEHIAGFRGKVDPGRCFDWELFFKKAYSRGVFPARLPLLDARTWALLEQAHGKVDAARTSPQGWRELSAKLEAFVGQAKTV